MNEGGLGRPGPVRAESATGGVAPGVWQWLGRAAVGVLLLALLGIGLVSAGVFDPRPVGEVVASQALAAVEVGAGERAIHWLPLTLEGGNGAARLSAAWESGEIDVAYGLVVGNEREMTVAAVAPTGYVALWREREEAEEGNSLAPRPWQTWPHVRPGEGSNEIWLERAGGRVTVRVNRELLWQGELAIRGDGIGLYAESFGERATVRFQWLELYRPR